MLRDYLDARLPLFPAQARTTPNSVAAPYAIRGRTKPAIT
jgi:hypothetical protein